MIGILARVLARQACTLVCGDLLHVLLHCALCVLEVFPSVCPIAYAIDSVVPLIKLALFVV